MKKSETNHLNYMDDEGVIYCVKRNKLVKLVDIREDCFTQCRRFQGTIQGKGVECSWIDNASSARKIDVYSPQAEYDRMNTNKRGIK